MLHGYMSCKESFFYSIEALSSRYRVTAPDFPGFGCSSPLAAAWSVSDYVGWLAKFAAEAGLETPHIIAHSFGARVAIKYAACRPCALSKLVITGGAGIVRPRTRAYRRRVAAYRLVKKFAPSFAERKFGSEEYRKLPPVMRESYKKIVNEDLRGCCALIRAPALFIYGRDDSVTPAREEGAALSSAVKGARLEVIEGGHFCFSENAAAFNSLVSAFLD